VVIFVVCACNSARRRSPPMESAVLHQKSARRSPTGALALVFERHAVAMDIRHSAGHRIILARKRPPHLATHPKAVTRDTDVFRRTSKLVLCRLINTRKHMARCQPDITHRAPTKDVLLFDRCTSNLLLGERHGRYTPYIARMAHESLTAQTRSRSAASVARL
jgi:hypothetical protein